jgi:plasmid replication initiation protein
MLRPNKHSHPDRTVVAAATVVLRELRKRRVVGYDDLIASLEKTATTSADVLFLPAVSLLHLLGLVEYQANVDTFEYRGGA